MNEIQFTFFNKNRLLHQLGLPSLEGPALVRWVRPQDFFGDHFELRATALADSLHFSWIHMDPSTKEREIWGFTVGLSETGRALIRQSNQIDPPLRTIARARDLLMNALTHTQCAVPFLEPIAKNGKSRFNA